MKKKHHPKLKLFTVRCPKCGSDQTKLDLLATENLKRVPLSIITAGLTVPGFGTKLKMKCRASKHKFLG